MTEDLDCGKIFTATPMDGNAVLALPMRPNDADATTIRGYLIALLRGVWVEGEGFSGKRPFGNSGWQTEVVENLVRGSAVSGSFDSYGYVQAYDQRQVDAVMGLAIAALGEADAPSPKTRTYMLVRSDDNGHTFIVLESTDEARVVAKYASLLKGHKQLYSLLHYEGPAGREAIISAYSIRE